MEGYAAKQYVQFTVVKIQPFVEVRAIKVFLTALAIKKSHSIYND